MKKCLVLSILILTIACLSLSWVPGVYASGRYEYYDTGADHWGTISHNPERRQGQVFTPTVTHTLTSIRLPLWRSGYPDLVYAAIYLVNASGLPEGDKISTEPSLNASDFNETAAWYTFTFTEITVTLDVEYAIVLRCNSETSSVLWAEDQTSPTYSAGWYLLWQVESGWLKELAYDFLFEVWGEDISCPTYSNVGHSSETVNHACNFSCYWNDNGDLDKGIFSTNNTGPWVNNTIYSFTSTPSWYNVTKTLNNTVGLVIGYRWYANDTMNNKNATAIYTLTTLAPSGSGDPLSTNTFYISPIYLFFGKVADILGCFGAIAVIVSRVKSIKDGLRGFVISLIIAMIFFVIWFIMTSLEDFA